MKPFNLELAKAGGKVQTREGNAVRILCYDLNSNDGVIVGAETVNEKEQIETYSINGEYYDDATVTRKDLFMVTVKKEGWINVYLHKEFSDIYDTKEDAQKYRLAGCLDTIKINWNE